jgi:type IV secretory pathway TrbL component
MIKADKKCGKSGIANEKKCHVGAASSAKASRSGNTLLNIAKGAALAGGAVALGSALAGSGKSASQAQTKPSFGQFTAPSIPRTRKKNAEMNRAKPGRRELREIRAIGKKAERNVSKGTPRLRAAANAARPRLLKRRRDLGSFYKDARPETKMVRDRLSKIMDGYRKPKF